MTAPLTPEKRAIMLERERRYWTIDQWREVADEHEWPAAIARCNIERDEAVDALLERVETLEEALERIEGEAAASWIADIARAALAGGAKPENHQRYFCPDCGSPIFPFAGGAK